MKKLIALVLCLVIVLANAVPGTWAYGEDEPEVGAAPAAGEQVPAEGEVEIIAEVSEDTEIAVGEAGEGPAPEAAAEEAEAEPEAEPELESAPVRELESESKLVKVVGVLPAEAELVAEQVADPFAKAEPMLAPKGLLSAPAAPMLAAPEGDPAPGEEGISAEAEAEDGWKAAAFYDIKLLNGGEALLPEGAVTVTIEDVPLTVENGVVSVKHFLDSEEAIRAAIEDGSAEAVADAAYAAAFPAEAAAAEAVTGEAGIVFVETITAEDGLVVEGSSVTFPAKSFSIYAVGEEEDHYRLNVTFHKADGTAVDMLVKAADIESIDTIIYDPGTGELPLNKLFRGWTTTENYTSETPAKNIDGIREEIAAILTAGLEDDLTGEEQLDVYAMLFNAYTVTFKDETGAVIIKVDDLLFKDTTPADERVYNINEPYTPANADANFVGWKVTSGSDNISAPANGLYYPNETDAVLSGSVVFEPYLENGWWISFIENGKGATYTGPQFVKNGELSHAPEKNPTRLGYTFGGWYLNEQGTGEEYTFEQELTGRLNLYASWIAVEQANYTVIIWKQNVAGTGYDFEESISFTGHVNTFISVVTEEGTGNNRHAVVDNVDKTYEGFHLDGFETGVPVAPEGTAVLNVYYDRNEVTLNYYLYGDTQNDNYTELPDTDNSTSPQFGLIDGEYEQLTYTGGKWYYSTGETGWVSTTSNNTSPQQYGVVNGEYVELYYRSQNGGNGNRRWQYISGYRYDRVGSLDVLNGPYFGIVNGDYVELTWDWSDLRWEYGNGTEYRGNRYTRSPQYTNYTGTRYIQQQATAEYTGIRYRKDTSRWTIYKSYKGLYGSTLADNNYTWPSEYDWYAIGNNNGTTDGMRTTFLDAFLPSDAATMVNFYGRTAAGGSKSVEFWKQKADKSGYELDFTVPTSSNASFSISDKYNGFHAAQYSTDNGQTWTNLGGKDSDGYYATGVTYSSKLMIRFDRDSYKLTFWDGAYFNGNGVILADHLNMGQLKEVNEVLYGEDISSYNKGGADYFEPETTGFVFEGWYYDDQCTQPCTFTTLPEGGLSVYAKWRQRQYRVFLHPNIPTDEEFEWADINQTTSFRVDYNAVISSGKVIDGERTGYEIVGWYRDEAMRQSFNFESHLTENTVTAAYDKTRPSELDKWGSELGEKRTYTDGKDYVWAGDDWYMEDGEMVPWNKDESRFWIEQSLDLYAKWRRVIDGAKGIYLEYNGDGGTPVPEDDTPYLDQAPAIAGGAPTSPDDTKVFKYWIVMKWNGSEYEETSEHILPSDEFTVQLAYAKAEDIQNPAPGGDTKKYTVQLKAYYGPIEEETKTQIIYDGNGGTIANAPAGSNIEVSGNRIIFKELTVNADHTALAASTYTREGYEFLGWALSATAATPDFTAGQTIAADNLDPTDNILYAVWKEKTVEIKYEVIGPTGSGTVSLASETVKVETGTPAGSTATAEEGYRFIGWFDNEACTGTALSTEPHFTPTKAEGAALWTDATYYAKFDHNTTTLTITNTGMSGHGEQGAIFTITGKGYESGLKIAVPNGQSVTIAGVYVGETYEITEEGSWSWRYTQKSVTTKALAAGGNYCTITNVPNGKNKWLSDCAWSSTAAFVTPDGTDVTPDEQSGGEG